MNLNDLSKPCNSERVRVCGRSWHRGGLSDLPPWTLRDHACAEWTGVFQYRVVKIVNSGHVPDLGDFYKCNGGEILCFSQGWIPEPIDTVTVGCKNILNSLSKIIDA